MEAFTEDETNEASHKLNGSLERTMVGVRR
jgi:hypothetical protein